MFVRCSLLCSTWAAVLFNFNIKYEISDFTSTKCSQFKKEETEDGLLSCGASAAARRPFVEAEPKAVWGPNVIFHFDGRYCLQFKKESLPNSLSTVTASDHISDTIRALGP